VDNSIADPIPGIVLYNISEGIMATELSPWFSRWLMCQELTHCSTVLEIRDTAGKIPTARYVTAAGAALLNLALVVMPALMGDWYGFSTALSLAGLVIVRLYILRACRLGLDYNTQMDPKSRDAMNKEVKLFVTLPSGKFVTVKTTTGIAQRCLLTEARP